MIERNLITAFGGNAYISITITRTCVYAYMNTHAQPQSTLLL